MSGFRLLSRRSLEGAIAQLGERLLCKQEVVGSIPSGSTSLRSWSETKAAASEPEGRRRAGACQRGALKGKGGRVATSFGSASQPSHSSVKTYSRMQCVAFSRRLHA